MADVADAPGPASPKPGDVALQQASRANSPDKDKLSVFISYSRKDVDFADQLYAALRACSFDCVIDHDIPGGEEWKRRLGSLISEADTVVFVLTPTSASSPICKWEVEQAERLGKRILSANSRPLEGATPPPQLRERNYIFFYAHPEEPGAGFGTGLAKLVAALNTDFDWLREHTRYLQRATEWDSGGREANRLLSGDDIAEARAWAKRRPKNAPEPTALHLDFIRASEVEAESQLSARRKQVEEVAAAQAERATALKSAEDALHKRARIRNIALVVVSLFAVLAAGLGLFSEQQRRTADQSRKAAEEQREKVNQILGRANDIIFGSLGRMDSTTLKDVFAVWQVGADHGDVETMGNLGWLYHNAIGVAQDNGKALEWWEKAADKGSAGAMYNLGVFYAHSHGVAKDYTKARAWYEKAADKGNANAMFNLGLLYMKGDGVAKDYTKAREWWEKAVDNGHVDAMINLALLYQNGEGVPQDYAKARDWYEKAADKGELTAMFGLGVLYVDAQDYAKATHWYEKAADKGDPRAMHNLALLHENGEGVPQDYVKARAWYEKAADKGSASSMRNLAVLYFDGREGTKDYVKALQWQEAYAAKVEAAESDLGKPGEETARELNRVIWYALFAREFAKALTAAERAHALLPDDVGIESNRAHALMFVGRGEDCKALHLAYKGKSVSGQLWEQVIVEDFTEFRKAGATHPMMADIEKELGVSP